MNSIEVRAMQPMCSTFITIPPGQELTALMLKTLISESDVLGKPPSHLQILSQNAKVLEDSQKFDQKHPVYMSLKTKVYFFDLFIFLLCFFVNFQS